MVTDPCFEWSKGQADNKVRKLRAETSKVSSCAVRSEFLRDSIKSLDKIQADCAELSAFLSCIKYRDMRKHNLSLDAQSSPEAPL